jgi:hypothetical protein
MMMCVRTPASVKLLFTSESPWTEGLSSRWSISLISTSHLLNILIISILSLISVMSLIALLNLISLGPLALTFPAYFTCIYYYFQYFI